jgi:hypothetical protein
MRSDWERIGEDLRTVMRRADEEETTAPASRKAAYAG